MFEAQNMVCDVYQELTGLQNGLYEMNLQAVFRPGDTYTATARLRACARQSAQPSKHTPPSPQPHLPSTKPLRQQSSRLRHPFLFVSKTSTTTMRSMPQSIVSSRSMPTILLLIPTPTLPVWSRLAITTAQNRASRTTPRYSTPSSSSPPTTKSS